MNGRLVVISGLPWVGKTSIAEIVDARTRSVYLSIDGVNDSEPARQTWRASASSTGARLEFVHLVIFDVQEHERRLSGRDRGLAYVGEPSWSDVERRRADYAGWSDGVVELDTARRTADEVADALAVRLSSG